MTARSRSRQRLARASFGPEWRPIPGSYVAAVRDVATPRAFTRWMAALRQARRDLAAAEARWEAARDAEAAR